MYIDFKSSLFYCNLQFLFKLTYLNSIYLALFLKFDIISILHLNNIECLIVFTQIDNPTFTPNFLYYRTMIM